MALIEGSTTPFDKDRRMTDGRLADLLADKYKRPDVDEVVQALKAERKRIKELEAEIERLDDLKYRHECLKSMYSDEMNYMNDSQSVDNAIDDFISEEESHS